MPKACDICPQPAVAYRRAINRTRLYACVEHRPYLAAWVQDERSEARSDSRASARYELAAYGRRDD